MYAPVQRAQWRHEAGSPWLVLPSSRWIYSIPVVLYGLYEFLVVAVAPRATVAHIVGLVLLGFGALMCLAAQGVRQQWQACPRCLSRMARTAQRCPYCGYEG